MLDVVMSVVLLVFAGACATSAAVLLARANPDARLPWVGTPPKRPWHFYLFYALTLFSGILGTEQLEHHVGLAGGFLTFLAVVLVPFVVVTIVHNRRMRRA